MIFLGKTTWTDEEKQRFVELYPEHTDWELCDILGKRVTQLRSMKERLGLRAKWTGKKDLVGEQYGFLTVISEAEKTPGSSNTRWNCKCGRCGSVVAVSQYWLQNSNPYGHCECTKSDPTYSQIKRGKDSPSYKHGGCGTKLYKIWCAMRRRTTNSKQWNYQYYGARGIKICDEWKEFAVFQDWALKNGYKDGLSIDRINTDGNYEPGNCRWVLPSKQQGNRRPFNPHRNAKRNT